MFQYNRPQLRSTLWGVFVPMSRLISITYISIPLGNVKPKVGEPEPGGDKKSTFGSSCIKAIGPKKSRTVLFKGMNNY